MLQSVTAGATAKHFNRICFQQQITSLNAWYSRLRFDGHASVFFRPVTPVKVSHLRQFRRSAHRALV